MASAASSNFSDPSPSQTPPLISSVILNASLIFKVRYIYIYILSYISVGNWENLVLIRGYVSLGWLICNSAIVVPVLFQHSLKDVLEDASVVGNLEHIFGVEPMKITSPSTDEEVALALRALEGCCLLHRESTLLAHQHNAIPVMLLVTVSVFTVCFF